YIMGPHDATSLQMVVALWPVGVRTVTGRSRNIHVLGHGVGVSTVPDCDGVHTHSSHIGHQRQEQMAIPDHE
ncbi:MAG: hypothetical protein WA970_21750, partial [Gammaproteobacteria bacterium]